VSSQALPAESRSALSQTPTHGPEAAQHTRQSGELEPVYGPTSTLFDVDDGSWTEAPPRSEAQCAPCTPPAGLPRDPAQVTLLTNDVQTETVEIDMQPHTPTDQGDNSTMQPGGNDQARNLELFFQSVTREQTPSLLHTPPPRRRTQCPPPTEQPRRSQRLASLDSARAPRYVTQAQNVLMKKLGIAPPDQPPTVECFILYGKEFAALLSSAKKKVIRSLFAQQGPAIPQAAWSSGIAP
jgi:hypothetical protein